MCRAMTDVGRALKCISPSVMVCFGLKRSQLTGDYAAVCTQEHGLCLVQLAFGFSKWCVDSFLTFMNEGCSEG